MDLRFLISREQHAGAPILSTGLWWGQVVTPVPVFPNGSDPLYFIIPDIDANTVWHTRRWHQRTADEIINLAEGLETQRLMHLSTPRWPVAGNEVLVAFDNRQQIWVVSWR